MIGTTRLHCRLWVLHPGLADWIKKKVLLKKSAPNELAWQNKYKLFYKVILS